MYDHLSIAKLKVKQRMCSWILELIRTKWSDDPRAPEALRHYQAEYTEIVRALQSKPVNQIIVMKSLQMRADTN